MRAPQAPRSAASSLQSPDTQVGGRELARPVRRAAVHPCAAAPGGARGLDVEPRIVPDVDDVARGELKLAREPLEAAAVGLAGADLARIERHRERRVEPDAREVGVAVAEGGERVGAPEARERRAHVGQDLHLVPRGEEHLEGARGDVFLVAALARVLLERGEAQVGDVVRVVRLGARQLLARRAHVRQRNPLGDARTVPVQPLEQARFRARQHRLHIPQCIIEVERDGAHVVQHTLKVTT